MSYAPNNSNAHSPEKRDPRPGQTQKPQTSDHEPAKYKHSHQHTV